jgi:hypothetical protein
MAKSVFSEAYFGVGFLVFSGTFPRYIGRNIAFINSLCTLMHSSLPFLPPAHTQTHTLQAFIGKTWAAEDQ